MFDATPEPSAADSAPADPTIEVCERHLRLLREVAEVAMEVTRAFGASAMAAGKAVEEILADKTWQPETGRARALAGSKDAAEAFHKAARALRLTLALEKATAETLRDLRAGVVREPKPAPAPSQTEKPASCAGSPAAPRDALRDQVRDLVTDAIANAADPTPAREMADDLGERLVETDRFGPLLRRPLREVVEQICADIRLAPDWIGLFDDKPAPPAADPGHEPAGHETECVCRPDAPPPSLSPCLEAVREPPQARCRPAGIPQPPIPRRE